MSSTPDGRKKTRSRKGKGRRARGTGSIFWSEERGVYVGRKIVGRGQGGRPLYREVSATTKEAVVKLLDTLGPARRDITVEAWATRWLEGLSVRKSTKYNYEDSVKKHITPAIGGLKVADVTPSRVKALNVTLGETLEASTVAKIHSHARTLFEAARIDGIRPDNPFSLVRRPTSAKKKIDPFTPAQLRRIVASDFGLPAGGVISLLAAVGCRLGEASALDVTDWNPATGKLTISKTYHNSYGIGPPKSKHGDRVITVPIIARAVLNTAAAGRTEGPLFRSRKGAYFCKAQIQRSFRATLKRLDLKERNLHQLRHSVATALIAAGHPIADVAVYLGDSPDTIVKTYLHASGADAGLALDKLFA